MLKKIKEQEWTIETAAINESWFSKKGKNFIHYGRDIEALLTHVKIAHGRRIYGKSKEQMKHINAEDLERGYTQFIENSKKQEDKSFLRDIYV
jgi:hypothetical protein